MKKSIITHTIGLCCAVVATLVITGIIVNQDNPATVSQLLSLIVTTSLFWIEIFVLDSIKEKNP